MFPKEKQFLLSILRDRSISMETFRKTTQALAECLAQEHRKEKEVVLIPILRSGIAMLPAFISLFPNAPVGFLGMFRDEKTLQPHLYYEKLPLLVKNQKIFILDPMLATGGSADLAIQLLLEKGVKDQQVAIISLLGSKRGVLAIQEKYPKVQIECVAIDENLDALGFILPGIGDFGDRFFGT